MKTFVERIIVNEVLNATHSEIITVDDVQEDVAEDYSSKVEIITERL